MSTQNQIELTNAEYVKAVIDLQPTVIATVNKKLSAKARKLVEADYEKWIIQCREHRKDGCWDNTCDGELESKLEYKPAEESGASIVTDVCNKCGNKYRLQDYAENYKGMQGRTSYEHSRVDEDI
ncbi:unnamed protein product, partial [marine sediment metagenome]